MCGDVRGTADVKPTQHAVTVGEALCFCAPPPPWPRLNASHPASSYSTPSGHWRSYRAGSSRCKLLLRQLGECAPTGVAAGGPALAATWSRNRAQPWTALPMTRRVRRAAGRAPPSTVPSAGRCPWAPQPAQWLAAASTSAMARHRDALPAPGPLEDLAAAAAAAQGLPPPANPLPLSPLTSAVAGTKWTATMHIFCAACGAGVLGLP